MSSLTRTASNARRRPRALTGLLLLGAALLVPALLGSDCDPETEDSVSLWASAGVPPGMTAQLWNTEDQERLQLTQGVVFGVSAWSSCYCQDLCEGVSFTVQPEGLLELRPVYQSSGDDGMNYVVIAKQLGGGALTVHSPCAAQTYAVTVLAQAAE